MHGGLKTQKYWGSTVDEAEQGSGIERALPRSSNNLSVNDNYLSKIPNNLRIRNNCLSS